MKKFLIMSFLAVLLCSLKVTAQINSVTGDFTPYEWGSDLYTASWDTITNTGADTVYIKIPNDASTITFSTTLTKFTGNSDSVNVSIYGGVDAVSPVYTLLQTAWAANVSTAQPFNYVLTGNPYTHYRIIVTGKETNTTQVKRSVLIRGRKR